MRKKKRFLGFGFDPGESLHHFAVVIPEDENTAVIIEERFVWGSEGESENPKDPSPKAVLDRYRWERIAEAAQAQFNTRIRTAGHRSVPWKKGGNNTLAPHFGKELTLLAWAVEDIDESFISHIIDNWAGLVPEERWWLYTTINATFRKPEIGRDRGWRKAIKIAFAENPVLETPVEKYADAKPIKLPQKKKPVKPTKSVQPKATKKKRGSPLSKSDQLDLFKNS